MAYPPDTLFVLSLLLLFNLTREGVREHVQRMEGKILILYSLK